MNVSQYIEKLNNRFKTGISTEHTYRGDLQTFLEALATDVQVTNEPTRIACGAPDYIITKRNIPVGYIEAKDIRNQKSVIRLIFLFLLWGSSANTSVFLCG